MKKDSIFWVCMVLNMVALLLLVVLKPEIHLLPRIMMHIIIKLNLALQIGVGIYGLWVSTDSKLFNLFIKIYAALLIFYVLLKIPALRSLNEYLSIIDEIFTPFPFVFGWVINKAFFQTKTEKV